jgi:hypothetical protein
MYTHACVHTVAVHVCALLHGEISRGQEMAYTCSSGCLHTGNLYMHVSIRGFSSPVLQIDRGVHVRMYVCMYVCVCVCVCVHVCMRSHLCCQ